MTCQGDPYSQEVSGREKATHKKRHFSVRATFHRSKLVTEGKFLKQLDRQIKVFKIQHSSLPKSLASAYLDIFLLNLTCFMQWPSSPMASPTWTILEVLCPVLHLWVLKQPLPCVPDPMWTGTFLCCFFEYSKHTLYGALVMLWSFLPKLVITH